jgi:hypothetical protein
MISLSAPSLIVQKEICKAARGPETKQDRIRRSASQTRRKRAK